MPVFKLSTALLRAALEAVEFTPTPVSALHAHLCGLGGERPARTLNSLFRAKCVTVDRADFPFMVTITDTGREALKVSRQKAQDAKPWTVPYPTQETPPEEAPVIEPTPEAIPEAPARPAPVSVHVETEDGCACKPGDPCYFHFTRGKR